MARKKVGLNFEINLDLNGFKKSGGAIKATVGGLEKAFSGLFSKMEALTRDTVLILTQIRGVLVNIENILARSSGFDKFAAKAKRATKKISDDAKRAAKDIQQLGDAANNAGTSKGFSRKQAPRGPPELPPAISRKQKDKDSFLGTPFQEVNDILPVRGPLVQLTGLLFLLQGAIFGAERAFERLTESILGSNRAMEQANVSLGAILGNAEKAKNVIEGFAIPFAARAPFFGLQEILENVERLAAEGFSARQITGNLESGFNKFTGQFESQFEGSLIELLGSAAVTFGKSLDQSTDAFISAIQGRFVKIRRFGIDESTLQRFGFSGNRENAADIESSLIQVLDLRFSGLLEKQSKSFTGIISNLEDIFENVKRKVFQGTFESVKEELYAIASSLKDVEAAFSIVFDSASEDSERAQAALAKLDPTQRRIYDNFKAISNVGAEAVHQFFALGKTILSMKEIIFGAILIPLIVTTRRGVLFLFQNLIKSILGFAGFLDSQGNFAPAFIKQLDKISKPWEAFFGARGAGVQNYDKFIKALKTSDISGEQLKKVEEALKRGQSGSFKDIVKLAKEGQLEGELLSKVSEAAGKATVKDKSFLGAIKAAIRDIKSLKDEFLTLEAVIKRALKIETTADPKAGFVKSGIERIKAFFATPKQVRELANKEASELVKAKHKALLDKYNSKLNNAKFLQNINSQLLSFNTPEQKVDFLKKLASKNPKVAEALKTEEGFKRLKEAIEGSDDSVKSLSEKVERLSAKDLTKRINSLGDKFYRTALNGTRLASVLDKLKKGFESTKIGGALFSSLVPALAKVRAAIEVVSKAFVAIKEVVAPILKIVITLFKTTFNILITLARASGVAIATAFTLGLGLIGQVIKILLLPAIIDALLALSDLSKGFDNMRTRSLKALFDGLGVLSEKLGLFFSLISTGLGFSANFSSQSSVALDILTSLVDMLIGVADALISLTPHIVYFLNLLKDGLAFILGILGKVITVFSDFFGFDFGVELGLQIDALAEKLDKLGEKANLAYENLIALGNLKITASNEVNTDTIKNIQSRADEFSDPKTVSPQAIIDVSKLVPELDDENISDQLLIFSGEFKKKIVAAIGQALTDNNFDLGGGTAGNIEQAFNNLKGSESTKQIAAVLKKGVANVDKSKLFSIERELFDKIAKGVSERSELQARLATGQAASVGEVFPEIKAFIERAEKTLDKASASIQKLVEKGEEIEAKAKGLRLTIFKASLAGDKEAEGKAREGLAGTTSELLANAGETIPQLIQEVDRLSKDSLTAREKLSKLDSEQQELAKDAREFVSGIYSDVFSSERISQTIGKNVSLDFDAIIPQSAIDKIAKGGKGTKDVISEVFSAIVTATAEASGLSSDSVRAQMSELSAAFELKLNKDATRNLRKEIRTNIAVAESELAILESKKQKVQEGVDTGDIGDSTNLIEIENSIAAQEKVIETLQKQLKDTPVNPLAEIRDIEASRIPLQAEAEKIGEALSAGEKALADQLNQIVTQKDVTKGLIDNQRALGKIAPRTAAEIANAFRRLVEEQDSLVKSEKEYAEVLNFVRDQFFLVVDETQRAVKAADALNKATEFSKLAAAVDQFEVMDSVIKSLPESFSNTPEMIAKIDEVNTNLINSLNAYIDKQIQARVELVKLGAELRNVVRTNAQLSAQQNLRASFVDPSSGRIRTSKEDFSSRLDALRTQQELANQTAAIEESFALLTETNKIYDEQIAQITTLTSKGRLLGANENKINELIEKRSAETLPVVTNLYSGINELSNKQLDLSSQLADLEKERTNLIKEQRDQEDSLLSARRAGLNSVLDFQESFVKFLQNGQELNAAQDKVFSLERLRLLDEELKNTQGPEKRIALAKEYLDLATGARQKGFLTGEQIAEITKTAKNLQTEFKKVDFGSEEKRKLQEIVNQVQQNQNLIESTTSSLGQLSNKLNEYLANLTSVLDRTSLNVSEFTAVLKKTLSATPLDAVKAGQELSPKGFNSDKLDALFKEAKAGGNKKFADFLRLQIANLATGNENTLDTLGSKVTNRVANTNRVETPQVTQQVLSEVKSVVDSLKGTFNTISEAAKPVSNSLLELSNKTASAKDVIQGIVEPVQKFRNAEIKDFIPAQELAEELITAKSRLSDIQPLQPQQPITVDNEGLKEEIRVLRSSIEQLAPKIAASLGENNTELNLTLDASQLRSGSIEDILVRAIYDSIRPTTELRN